MYVDIFLKTNAKIAYRYGVLPLELLFPEMPDNNLYTLRNFNGKTTLFRNGFGNEYAHNSSLDLLRNPVITDKYHKTTLAVEITSRPDL